MATEYDIEVISQPSIYQPSDRTIRIFFDEPDAGINPDTGILLLIAGYGGQVHSNVYKKMRKQFSDQYNLVTVQCNYMGWEFMQAEEKHSIPVNQLTSFLTEKEIAGLSNDPAHYRYLLKGKTFHNIIPLDEKPSYLNDMGPAQAMDCLISLKVVMDILKSNGYTYNHRKVIAYGNSHGAYIAHLCNAFSPRTLSSIIDISSYLFPHYIERTRTITVSDGNCFIENVYSYLLGRGIIKDYLLYDLNHLYTQFDNRANIIAFHGVNDNMTTTAERLSFLDQIPHTFLEIIDPPRVDHVIFNSCDHGVGADFLKLFDYVYHTYPLESDGVAGEFMDHQFKTPYATYYISNKEDIPLLYYKSFAPNC